MLLYELFQPQTEGMGFLGEKDVEEAANAAQQAAIAIAMKKAGNKPKTINTKKNQGHTVSNRVPGK
jgi:hypothetical protein